MSTTNYAIFTSTRVGRNGNALAGSRERKYVTTTAERAARNAARATLTDREIAAATVQQDGDVWTFTPATGSPVRIRVSY
jgi:hypothetical protein